MLWHSKTAQRNATGHITAYIGRNGSGKTLHMVGDALPTLRGKKWKCDDAAHYHTRIGITEGYRNVLSTVPIYNPATRNPHALYVPYTDHEYFLVAEHSDVLLDEISAIFPSRGYGSLPDDVIVLLNQLRKPDLKISWSAPDWQRCDVVLREITQLVVSMRPAMVRFDNDRAWKRYSLFLIRAFEGNDFRSWIQRNRIGKVKPVTTELYYRTDSDTRKHGFTAQDYYDTNSQAIVPMVRAAGGTCVICSGARKKEYCSCSDDVKERMALAAARRFWSNQYAWLEDEETVVDVSIHEHHNEIDDDVLV